MLQNAFEKRYKELSKAQKEAVDTIEGPVMVVAGPGTGKTTILTLRIANILKKTDTPPSGILAITYTEAGVKAMRIKLRSIIGNRADEVRIHTFHGFASSVISEFKDHFLHLDRCGQLNEIEAETLVRNILKDKKFIELRPFANPDFYIQKIISSIGDCKKESITPDMVVSFVKDEMKRIRTDEGSLSTRGKTKGKLKAEAEKQIEKCERTLVFADVYSAYESLKKDNRKIDFDDLISELLISLSHDEQLLRMLQEKFLYILIDEHQDTNNSQNEIIRKLADFFDTPNVFIVGDEKQAIYRFQGASVENFLKFQNIWSNMKIIQLKDNYRSHQNILDASFSMIENNYDGDEYENLRVKLRASGADENNKVELVSGGNIFATEKYLVHQLKNILQKDKEATIAIITKTNRDLERVISLCEKNGLPVSSERSIDIFSHPIGSLFFDLVEFFHDPVKIELIAKTFVSGLWGVSFDSAISTVNSLRSGDVSVLQKIPELVKLQREFVFEGALNYLILMAELSGFQNMVARDPANVEVWRGIVNLSENLIRSFGISDPRELLARLVAYRASSEMRSVKLSVGTPDMTISAMTAHGSKGLEFDYVFIPYATENSWVGKNWGSYFVLPESRTSNGIQDIRRLFYVALTRAKKHVSVLYGQEENGEIVLPLRFIDELSEEHVSRVILSKEHNDQVSSLKSRPVTDLDKKIQEYTKNTLLKVGLSVTAINHFQVCPNYFLYQSILKLPQAPSVSAEKGNAMHLAISRVWLSSDRHLNQIKKIIGDTVVAFFEQSLLPKFEKEIAVKELLDSLDTVSEQLQYHFSQPGTVFSEIWSESEYKGQFNGDEITLPIHGKLDSVIDSGKDVFVFDYKTRQALSLNEIQGKTKNSKGEYFRQLVFYKLLLQKDSRFSGKNIIPSLIFTVPDNKGRCVTVTPPVVLEDMEQIKTEIAFLIQSVWSGEFLYSRCEDKKCEWCRLRSL